MFIGLIVGATLGLLNIFPLLPLGLLFNVPVTTGLFAGVVVGYEASSSIIKMINYLNLGSASENPQLGAAITRMVKEGRGLTVIDTVGEKYLFAKVTGLLACLLLIVVGQESWLRVTPQVMSIAAPLLAGGMWLVLCYISSNRIYSFLLFGAGAWISKMILDINNQYSMLALSSALFSVGGTLTLLGQQVPKLNKQKESEGAIEAGDPGFMMAGIFSSVLIGVPNGALVESLFRVVRKTDEDYRDDLDHVCSNALADGASSSITLFMGLAFQSTRSAVTTGMKDFSFNRGEISFLLIASCIISIAAYYYVLPSVISWYMHLTARIDQRVFSVVQIMWGGVICLVVLGPLVGAVTLAIGVLFQLAIQFSGVKKELSMVPMSLVPLIGFVV